MRKNKKNKTKKEEEEEGRMSEKREKPSTKEKLKSIVNDFDTFDSEMKMGTRVRSSISPPLSFLSFLLSYFELKIYLIAKKRKRRISYC